jgi:hypothetical protein
VVKPANGWYAKVDQSTGEIGDKKRIADTSTPEFMEPILNDQKFKDFIKHKYEIAYGNIMGETPILEEEAEDAA